MTKADVLAVLQTLLSVHSLDDISAHDVQRWQTAVRELLNASAGRRSVPADLREEDA